MGPVENNMILSAMEVRNRLKEAKVDKPRHRLIEDQNAHLIKENIWLRGELAKLTAEVARLKPTYDTAALSRVLDIVAEGEKIHKVDLVSKRRTKRVALARQLCFYLGATKTHHSLPRIGRFFNKSDHTTVLYGRNKIAMLRLVDERIDQKLKDYESKIDSWLSLLDR